jgi:hypothetical protein
VFRLCGKGEIQAERPDSNSLEHTGKALKGRIGIFLMINTQLNGTLLLASSLEQEFGVTCAIKPRCHTVDAQVRRI